ncbi:AraC family transcriptional regulator [Vallitalea pronyensis]|uniref:Stage 0 sporulation protein A homolog n=1 Tax=Vallitalea pronyensis TaxID=1348613 RepID=A0A8J8MH75_9FIRM|nr:AraC family transcriptional regulator [Vallitalea pronyensis]QUI21427.1 AraC family transcriptional regulator [Vallitalea pronyensis]
MVYKILIVDDEKWIRKGIMSKLQHHQYTFSHVYEAENGVVALEIIEKEQPNIVITDIKMPLMDGIELMKAAKAYTDIKFIIVSGYADFEYARQAIEMSSYGYILKPISDQNFTRVLKKAMDDLEKKRDIHLLMQEKKVLEENNQAYMLNQQLNQAFHNNVTMSMDPYRYFVLGILHVHTTGPHGTKKTKPVIHTIKKHLKDDVSKMDSPIILADNYNNRHQIMVLLMGDDAVTLYKQSQKTFIHLFNGLKKWFDEPIAIGHSHPRQDITNTLYKQAMNALGYRLNKGYNRIYTYSEEQHDVDLPKEKINLLKHYIEGGHTGGIQDILQDIFSLKSLKNATSRHVKQCFMTIWNQFYQACKDKQIKHNHVIDSTFNSEKLFNQFDDLPALTSYLYTTIVDVLALSNDSNNLDMDNINKAKAYIEKHYREEITVKDLAHQLAMNPNYLSSAFKKEVGKSFKSYLTDKRIGEACQLLLETKASVAQISQSVGYVDPQYFYRVFKKHMDVTPLAYRNKNR